MNVDPTLLFGNNSTQRQTGSQTLGKDDFLKLLITQLQMQDPLQPMQDKEFISQMATFTSLEQTNNMTNLFTQFVQTQSVTSLSAQAQVIGKTISWTETNDEDSEPQTKTGIVNAVTLKDGKLTYVTEDGSEVNPQYIFSIKNTDNATPPASNDGEETQ
ncbi:MAG: flagellar hook assembly protein FlgD [Tuberibacillus sp.]